MTVGERLKQLRQAKGWSQAQLAQKLGVHQKQISAYERGVHAPSTDFLVRVGELCNVSLDYLAGESRTEQPRATVADRELLHKFEEIDRLPEKDKLVVKAVLDAFIKKHRFEELAAG